MRIGLIRCTQTEDMCPGTTCFKAMKERNLAFKGIEEEIEIIGFNSCGGCPGKKAVARAIEMVKRGADTIVFASCITKGNPVSFPCPNAEKMKEAIINKLGDKIKIVDYTH